MSKSLAIFAMASAITGAQAAAPAANPPMTLQTFTSDVKNTMSTKMPGMSINMVMTGKIFYDAPRRRVRNDFKSMKMDIVMDTGGGGFPDGSGGGGFPTGLPDGSGGGGLPTGGGSAAGGGMSIDMKGDGTELLRYDLGKNFTWFTTPEGTECTCVDIEGEMQPMYVDPMATKVASETIKVNGKDVTAEKWSSKLDIGGVVPGGGAEVSMDMSYWVEGSTKLAKVEMKSKVGMGGDNMLDDTTSLEFWNTVSTPIPDSEWVPHPSCSCKEAPKIPTATPADYPATAENCVAAKGCQCFDSATVTAELTFCKDIVTYPVLAAIFPKSTDDFTKTAYDASSDITASSAECQADYKEFLCRFYFQKCSDGGDLVFPGKFASAKCGAAAASVPANSGYTEAENLAAGKNAEGGAPENSDMSGATSAVASPVAALLLSAASLFLLRA
jgi:hypothetical protein